MNLAVDAVELRAFFVKRVSKFRSVGNGGTFFDGTLFHFLATFPPSLPPPLPGPANCPRWCYRRRFSTNPCIIDGVLPIESLCGSRNLTILSLRGKKKLGSARVETNGSRDGRMNLS